eukprot:CAMPEP_0170168714 /NCGR_PEP_ID=MMETSP0040_2-20121228/1661_1 /TAXON_ID=641309 /ORGANISM="Lotharella oceanica, Strain CCMP622" /LENGTH=408 /DNA_ID=CAMNT_0010407037 /DNA_START=57 /DNA_END=1283 /DNA_ORIENTATION=-
MEEAKIDVGTDEGSDTEVGSRMSEMALPNDRKSERQFQISFRKPGEPVKIWIRHRIFAITAIEAVKQAFGVRGLEEQLVSITEEEWNQWKRNPAAFSPEHGVETFGYNALTLDWKRYLKSLDGAEWMPPREGRREFRMEERVLIRKRMFEATWNEPFELQDFPFDVQELGMTFQCVTPTASGARVELRILGGHHFSKEFIEPQGQYEIVRRDTQNRLYAQDKFLAVEELLDNGTGQVKLTVWVRRNWFFYFHRVLFILSLITFLSNGAFLFENFSNQISYLMTALLTMVAYLFFVGAYIPAVRQITMMDAYIYGSAFFVFSVTVQIGCKEIYNENNNDISRTSLNVKYSFLFVNVIVFCALQDAFATWVACTRARRANVIKPDLDKKERRASLVLRRHSTSSTPWWCR